MEMTEPQTWRCAAVFAGCGYKVIPREKTEAWKGGEKASHHGKTATQTSWSISLETHFLARVSAFYEVVAFNWAFKCSW